MAETLALFREEQVWVARESVAGTQVDPVAADAVLPIAPCEVNQEIEKLKDDQVRNSRSRFSSIRGRTMPGSWAIPVFAKPSGTAGSVSEADTLLESAFGVQTIDAGVKVEYTFSSSPLPSFTLWRKLGHHLMVARGCVVDELSSMISGKEIGKMSFKGPFFEMALGAEDLVGTGGIDNVATTLPVTNGANFYLPAGMYFYIKVGAEVMKATARSNNNLTVERAQKGTTAAAHALNAPITFWDPGATEVGLPVHGKAGAITVDAATTVMLDCTITLKNNVKMYIDEKNGTYVAANYGTPGKREVTISTSKYLLKADARHLNDSLSLTNFAFIANLGDTTGKILEWSAPSCQKKSPVYSGSEEVEMSLEFEPIATTGDAELKLTIK